MHRATTCVWLALMALSLAATPLSASAVEANISGSITGGIDTFNAGNGYGDAYGRGYLPHLGKTFLYCPLVFEWWDPIHTVTMGQLRLTAANGDYLYAECGPTMTDEIASELSWEVMFVGGTGRFAEATGTATLVFHIADPNIWLTYGYGYTGWGGEYELLDATLDY